jgi:hypothetical protein
MMLAMAFNNGLRERTWSALPPGQTLREARGGTTEPDVGESLFPTPGAYHLTIETFGRVVAALDVRVLPWRERVRASASLRINASIR